MERLFKNDNGQFCKMAQNGLLLVQIRSEDQHFPQILFSLTTAVMWEKIRDWSLIPGRAGYKVGKSWVLNYLRPPPLKTG